jgi:glutamyl-Q tRNA(Asp) synthetase
MHLGHAFAAQVAHTLARQSPGGSFLLRHEDLDTPRVRDSFYQGIEDDLQWLGLLWDEPPLRQTTRSAAYQSALNRLQKNELIYPCFCTRRDIQNESASIASAPHAPQASTYPGTCRRLSPQQRHDQLAAGTPHAWRLDSHRTFSRTGPLSFLDLRFGSIAVNPDLLGDVILARKDIGCSYHLAVVIDDAFQQITHVTRGDDLLPSTHVHRLLQALLALPEPVYLHHPLVRDTHGKRLAKRYDALAITTLRQAGLTPAEALARSQPTPPCPHGDV